MPKARIVLWLATVGAVGLLLRSLFIAGVDTWLACLALAGYVGLVVLGSLVPQWEMYGDVFWRGDSSQKCVALSFDDGPDPAVTPKVLETLNEFGAVATFFLIGERAERHPELVSAIAEGGHQLAIHGYRHSHFYALLTPRRVERDIKLAQQVLDRARGIAPTLFRPPLGHVSPRTAAGATRAGVTLVAWSLRTLDGLARTRPRDVLERVHRRLTPGTIILLHDARRRGDAPPASLSVLPDILKLIRARGLQTVTVDDLARRSGWRDTDDPTDADGEDAPLHGESR